MFFQEFFQFTSSQRKGVLVLLFLLAFLGLSYIMNYNSAPKFDVEVHPVIHSFSETNKNLTTSFPSSEDSLFYFDPNKISASKWEKLGFSKKQVKSILHFRKRIGGFTSKTDVKKCYVINDEMFKKLNPFIIISKRENENKKLCNAIFLFQSNGPVYRHNKIFSNLSFLVKDGMFKYYTEINASDSIIQEKLLDLDTNLFPEAKIESLICSELKTIDLSIDESLPNLSLNLNDASHSELQKIKGIGPILSKRIIAYKKKLGGFISLTQLKEIYGLEDSVIYRIEKSFFVTDSILIAKKNINSITVDSLKKHPYINWNLANAIVEYRNQHGPYHTIEKIKSIHLVNDEIYLKIAPYLTIR